MLIGLVGRIGSGKGTVAEVLNNFNFNFVVFSDVISEEAKKRMIEVNRENLQNLGDQVRREEGGGAWVKKILEKIDLNNDYVFDGLRNPGEIKELRKTGKFFLIYIDCLQDIRFNRVKKSSNPKNPKTWEEFLIAEKRDAGINQPEYGQQVDKCIEMADFIIPNNLNIDNLKEKILNILNKIKLKC